MQTTTITPETKLQQTINPVHAFIRAINFAIDLFVWFVLAAISVVLLDHTFPTISHFAINALAYSVMVGLYVGYYMVFEFWFQKTLGKLITGTHVATINGGKPTVAAIFRRSLARLIPIDFISYFFRRKGLHDHLSQTTVVKTRKL